MTLVSQFTLATDPLWNYTTLLAWIMVELMVSMIAACAPTLAYLLPKSMKSRNQPSASGSRMTGPQANTGYGLGSRMAKKNNSEDMDSEEDERRIIVKEDIEMKWQGGSGSNSGSQADPADKSSVTSWYDENNPQSTTVVYAGPDRNKSMRTWVSTSELKGSGRASGIGQAQ
jgi:hypothetical protein